MSKISIIKEMWQYFKERKKWWLLPIVIFLLLFGMVLIFVSTSAFAPLIYPLF